MPGFGEQLERERLKRGIKLENISEQTKISTRMLRALETEEFEKLPGGVFNRGFVRSYARYLGMNEEQAVADYLAASGEAEPPLPFQQAEEPEEVARWLPLAGLVLLVLLSAFVLWQYRATFAAASRRVFARRAASVNASTATPASSPAYANPAPSPHAERPAASAVAPPGPAPILPQRAVAVAASKMPAPQPAAGATPGELNITVRARQQAWLSVTADGRPVMQGILEPAAERQFRATRKLVFVTGNAGGVDLTFNGAPYGPLGAQKQRRQITFTSDGVQQ
ncbi:MAG TPA: RodZ domain-containing protein [Terriglobales bacterium]|nr:RodZ domain-containing protein [Terriglobales bacterium]